MAKDSERVARETYGDLIEKVVEWPPGLGIDVHLVGGVIVQYSDGGKSIAVIQYGDDGEPVVARVTIRARLLRSLSFVRGIHRRVFGRWLSRP